MSGSPHVALLLEDEPLIAIDVEFILGQAGFSVTTVTSCADAFKWLEECRPDLVIVDIVLRDGACHAVVEQLIVDGIPFLVHSGDHPRLHADTVLSKGSWIDKPSDGAELVRVARELVAD